jgi:hypothetical protein
MSTGLISLHVNQVSNKLITLIRKLDRLEAQVAEILVRLDKLEKRG